MNEKEMLLKIMDTLDSMNQRMEDGFQEVKADVKKLNQRMDGLESAIHALDCKVNALEVKVEEGFKATRSEIVDRVDMIGHSLDSLRSTVMEAQSVSKQNSYELQLLKSKAQ